MTEAVFLICRLNTTLFQKITVWVPSHVSFPSFLGSCPSSYPTPNTPSYQRLRKKLQRLVASWSTHTSQSTVLNFELDSCIPCLPRFLFYFSVCISIYMKAECIYCKQKNNKMGEKMDEAMFIVRVICLPKEYTIGYSVNILLIQ